MLLFFVLFAGGYTLGCIAMVLAMENKEKEKSTILSKEGE